MCPSCGTSLLSGAGVCSNCGTPITIENNSAKQSHLYNATNELGYHLGNTTSETIKFFAILGIISLILPIAIMNPISVYHFLIKQRRFQSISETGRQLAYKLSFFYTAWFCIFILVILKISEADAFNSYLYWLLPMYGVIIIGIAILLIWNTTKEHFFKHQITIGILHILGTISLIVFATIPIPVLLIFKAFVSFT